MIKPSPKAFVIDTKLDEPDYCFIFKYISIMANIGKTVKLGVFTLAIMNVTAVVSSVDFLPKLNTV